MYLSNSLKLDGKEVSFKVTLLKLNYHKEQRNISSVTSLNTVTKPN